MNLPEPLEDLEELEGRFRHAFATGGTRELDVIGYGEISSVVAWGGRACKRLPDFPTTAAFESYRGAFSDYLERLAMVGVAVIPTRLQDLPGPEGTRIGYAIQPLIAPEHRAAQVLRGLPADEGSRLIEEIFRQTSLAIGDPLLGFDAQLPNWVLIDDQVTYIDITTPFIRDTVTGLQRLDTSLFVASLPWALRAPIRRWLAPSIIAEYFDLRSTLLDFAANLIKERLPEWIGPTVLAANHYLDQPISRDEVERYYRSNARMWAVLQRLRGIDRFWQLQIRRRPYPVLLPGPIDR